MSFSDVDNSRATGLIIKSGSNNFIAFNVNNGVNIYKPLLMNRNACNGIPTVSATSDIARGSITTTTHGSISSTSGNIQTQNGTVKTEWNICKSCMHWK